MKNSLFIFLLSFNLHAKDIKVLSIDTGVDLSHKEINEHIDFQDDYNYIDTHGHGTHIAGLILKDTCKQVKFISCRYKPSFFELFPQTLNNCLEKAVQIKPNFINISGGGFGENQYEKELLRILSDNGTIIVVAAGNNGKMNPDYYPAKYGFKNLIPVGNLDKNGYRNISSNYGYDKMAWENGTNVFSTFLKGKYRLMTGTSQATAIHTNRLLRKKCQEYIK